MFLFLPKKYDVCDEHSTVKMRTIFLTLLKGQPSLICSLLDHSLLDFHLKVCLPLGSQFKSLDFREIFLSHPESEIFLSHPRSEIVLSHPGSEIFPSHPGSEMVLSQHLYRAGIVDHLSCLQLCKGKRPVSLSVLS